MDRESKQVVQKKIEKILKLPFLCSTYQDVKMQIWLDTSPHTCHKNDECNDCTGSNVLTAHSRRILPLTKGDIAEVQGLILEHASPLYVQQCIEERWLVCNPTGLGHIAVFDAGAMLLFSLFETPVTIIQAAKVIEDWQPEKIEQIVTL